MHPKLDATKYSTMTEVNRRDIFGEGMLLFPWCKPPHGQ